MHVCFTQIKERVAAAPGYSLLAKAVLCTVSVVNSPIVFKVEPLQTVYEESKCFCGYSCRYQLPFLVNRFVTFLRLEK